MTRNQHDRTEDHFGLDLDTNIRIDGAVAGFADGSNLHDVLQGLGGVSDLAIVMDGSFLPIQGGIKGDVQVPFACEIVAARLFADQVGSIVVDIWKDTYAAFPPTSTDSMCGSSKPTISGALKSQQDTIVGLPSWTTTAIAAGDILRFHVDSCTLITRVTLALTLARS